MSQNQEKETRSPGHSCPVCSGTQIIEYLEGPDRFHWRPETYRLERCNGCGCVWLADPPMPEEMSHHYDQDYHRSIAKGGETNLEERWQWARQLIERHCQSGSILDIGCSSGSFLKTMQGPRWKLYGIEREPSTAERARTATGAEVFVGDAIDAPFPRESFDVITSFDLIEHVYNPLCLMQKVGAWLKDGGLFVGQIPNIDAWEARIFGSYWYGLELPRHLFHFSPSSVRHLMQASGLDEVSLTTAGNTYAEDSLLYLYLRSREKLGLRVIPPSEPRNYGIVFRAVRKAFRVTMLKGGGEIAGAAGVRPSMIAIFRKRDRSNASE